MDLNRLDGVESRINSIHLQPYGCGRYHSSCFCFSAVLTLVFAHRRVVYEFWATFATEGPSKPTRVLASSGSAP